MGVLVYLSDKIKLNKNDLKKINANDKSDFVLVFEDEIFNLKELLSKYKIKKEDIDKINIDGIELTNENSENFKLKRKTLLTTKKNLEDLNKIYNEVLKTDLIAVVDLSNRKDIKINNYEYPRDKIVFNNRSKKLKI